MINKRILSGIQPSGVIHIGNYFGAIRQWVTLQRNNESFYFIADLHSITIRLVGQQSELSFFTHSLDTAACLISSGIDPNKSTLFLQSLCPAHCELAWILSCATPLSWLNRMVQFKEKKQSENNTSCGLFNYPTLMAADILLYKPDIIPVGEDQTQHLELARNLADRINFLSKNTVLPIPAVFTMTESKRIMSLTNGSTKMSKSDPAEKSKIYINESNDSIRTKVKKATTDSINEVYYEPEKRPEVSNLINILCASRDLKTEEFANKYEGIDLVILKTLVTEALIETIEPIREKYLKVRENENELIEIMKEGSKRANLVGSETVREIKESLNILRKGI